MPGTCQIKSVSDTDLFRQGTAYFGSASQISRRMASGFDGFGSGWAAIHASNADSRSGWTRTPMVRPLPVRGRPIFFFSRSAIATVLTFG